MKDMLLGIWFETSKIVISRISVLKGPCFSVCIHQETSCGTASLFGRCEKPKKIKIKLNTTKQTKKMRQTYINTT